MIDLINGNLILKDKDKETPLLNGDTISFSYTLKNEDIRCRPKKDLTPYDSYKEYFDNLKDVNLFTKHIGDGLEITIKINTREYSEWGINLPFNFMGKVNGGGYQNQYLLNSPYKDKQCKDNFIYLSNPNGHNILIVFKTEYAYWKMDYSPYCGGHFFTNLKLLAELDKAYVFPKEDRNELTFLILEVKDFNEALDKVSEYLNKPVLSFDLSGGKIGTEVNITIHGKCDYINGDMNSIPTKNKKTITYKIKKEGETILVPYYNNIKGLDATLYGYGSIESLYDKSINSINFDDIAKTDGNLCEHQCYVSAALRYLLKYGKNEKYEKIALKALEEITETDPSKAKLRITVLDKPQENGYPAYHVFKSNRIQEQFFGVTIFLDAYKYFKEEKYLRYAKESLNTLIDYYQKDDGGFYTKMEWNDHEDDYSTVTCLIIPIIDMALFMKDIDKDLADKYIKSAEKLANHVYLRGLNFPTETIIGEEHEAEMEDGSISCSALTLLYFYNKIEKKEEYLSKAKEILDLHESWMVNTPLCNAYRSSLRWWETGWEGDKDGPALCLGHAWTIWRAEADFWMYKATNDEKYLLNAKNSFMTNFAKIDQYGRSYSIYCIDYITGGGFSKEKLVYKISREFPDQTDSGLSRYVWIRASETIIDYLI